MKNRPILLIIIVLGVIAYLLWEQRQKSLVIPESTQEQVNDPQITNPPKEKSVYNGNATIARIDALTAENLVVPYVKENGRLPDYYITKADARKLGWVASRGNLCDVLPGRAIGGDVFGNREKKLPAKNGRKWFEGDLNYHCGRRNADRILFSNDGLVYVTNDHYKTMQKR